MITPPIPLSVKVFFACWIAMVLATGHAAFEIWQLMDLVGIHGLGEVPPDQMSDVEKYWLMRLMVFFGALLICVQIFFREMRRAHGIAVRYVSRKPSQAFWVTWVSLLVPI